MSIAPPEPVADLVVACLEYVRRSTQFELDFSPDTLPVLDHYLSTVRETLTDRPELGPLAAHAAGAYFGEVVRGRIPGFWRLPSANIHDWQLCSQVAFLWFNPIGVGFDALHGSNEHDGPRSHLRCHPSDREFLERRLATLPPLPEDQYNLLTTRFEVIEVATEALRARLDEQGYGGSEMSEDDYAVDAS